MFDMNENIVTQKFLKIFLRMKLMRITVAIVHALHILQAFGPNTNIV